VGFSSCSRPSAPRRPAHAEAHRNHDARRRNGASFNANPRPAPPNRGNSGEQRTRPRVIDVGLKTEGRVALKEFGPGRDGSLKVGDEVEVYLERVENALGEAVSRATRRAAKRAGSSSKRRSSQGKARRRRHLQPGQGRLHRRSRRRRGLPAALAGRHPSDPRRRPADGRAAAVPDPQDGSPPRQHRRLAPHRARRDPRRTAPRDRRRTSKKARSSTAWSRTSPITVRSWTWAASTACCMSPTSPGAASTTRPKCSPSARR
jgi:hypothetical protein